MKTFIQKLGKSLMGPLSIIVAAGLLLGLASTLQNPNVFGNALANVSLVNNFVSLINEYLWSYRQLPKTDISIFIGI